MLLRSGASVTWAHHRVIAKRHKDIVFRLSITIGLGLYFTLLQKIEYEEASFTISDSVYGATFFVATGFHGIHVIVGTLFLLVNLVRVILYHFRSDHHFGFEAAA